MPEELQRRVTRLVYKSQISRIDLDESLARNDHDFMIDRPPHFPAAPRTFRRRKFHSLERSGTVTKRLAAGVGLMARKGRTGAAIDAMYAAAARPGDWTEAAGAIQSAFDGLPAMLLLADPVTGRAPMTVDSGLDPDAWSVFRAKYATAAENGTLAIAQMVEPHVPFRFMDVCGERAFYAMPVYQELMAPQGVEPWVNVIGGRDGASFVGIGLMGALNYRRPSGAEQERLVLLGRHLGRATRIARLLGQQPAATPFEALANTIAAAFFLLDAELELIWANAAALAIAARNDGLAVSGGQLRLTQPAEQALLTRRLNLARSAMRDGGLRVSRPSGKPPYLIRVLGLGPTLEAEGATLAVVVTESAPRTAVTVDLLRELFGLTQAEAAAAIVASETGALESAAAVLGISRNTVKTLLHRAFTKTGARSQIELARLLHAIAAGLDR